MKKPEEKNLALGTPEKRRAYEERLRAVMQERREQDRRAARESMRLARDKWVDG